MDQRDRQAIETLFGKLREVERVTPPRDAEAEAYIRSRIAEQPAAPYYMAQTIIMQEQALEMAQARIEALEQEADGSGSRGMFADLFGGGRTRGRGRSVPQMPRNDVQPQQPSPWGGGSFLGGAAQTALGVAGGVLLGSMIAGAFGGGEAQAAENDDASADDGGDDGSDDGDGDGGGDGGDFGGDSGGDFGGGGDF